MSKARKRFSIYNYKLFNTTLLVCLLGTWYWNFMASDLYVSEAHVIIQKTELASAPSMDVGVLFGNVGGNNIADQLLLRDHLLSVDMLKTLDGKLDLRSHYSDPNRDFWSRMWQKDYPLEEFYDYYRRRVHIDYDDYANILVVKAEGYDPKTAHAITAMLIGQGEQFMNLLAHNLAQEQVTFLEKAVETMGQRTLKARQDVIHFQNRHGLVSPEHTVENVAGIINHLEAQLTALQTTRTGLLGYLVPDSPKINEINMQIAAVEKQLQQEKSRLTSQKEKTLNSTVEEYQRLKLDAEFAESVHKTALAALEQGRIEASRTLKKMSIVQTPTLPEYPLEPRRIYNTIVFILATSLVSSITYLFAAIVRDHKE